MFGTECGRVPKLLQLSGRRLARELERRDDRIVTRTCMLGPVLSAWVALSLSAHNLADYLDRKGGIGNLLRLAGAQVIALLLLRLRKKMTPGSRLERHYGAFRASLMLEPTFQVCTSFFYELGVGLEFFQPAFMQEPLVLCQLSKAGRAVKFNTGWVPELRNFAPLPVRAGFVNLTFARREPRRMSDADRYPDKYFKRHSVSSFSLFF
jgi:hypothetical protein